MMCVFTPILLERKNITGGDKLWFSVGMRWYGGVFVGPTLASARYRYANAILTLASAVHR